MSEFSKAIEVFSGAQHNTKLADLGLGAHLGDIASSPSSVLSAGIYVQKKEDKPLVFEYKYDEFKMVLEGELHLKDLSNGKEWVAKVGDSISLPKGSKIEFSSPNEAKAFFVGNRGPGEL